jgi:myosin heavy chain 9/10/11/14
MLQANLEKHIKELKLKIVDLETKSYANSQRATIGRRPLSAVEEVAGQLQQGDASRLRSAEKIARDAKFQQAESERQRAKMDEERKAYQAEISQLRQAISDVVSVSVNLKMHYH